MYVLKNEEGIQMTVELFRNDSYLKSYNSRITEILEDGIILDKTIFYPEGGGQPGDIGKILYNGKNIEIIGTRYQNKKIVHLIEKNNFLKINDKIDINLNWDIRYSHMKVHTCLHLLCSIIPAPVTGGSIGDARGRLDFDIDIKPDKELILKQLNDLLNQDHLISINEITDDELDQNPELIRTMSVKPPRGSGKIRMISIGDGIDYQPCGGTHVNKTSEIGIVTSIKIENKGKMNKRIIIKL
jgi:misacylated tRNA(Ala) deacylase|tara:strand:- start:2470 stop:3195 length:726 start_codon:yes stop_codon:yes gene_type:complete